MYLSVTYCILCYRKADKVTVMAEAQIEGYDTPGPQYQVEDMSIFKKRSKSFLFDNSKTKRLDPIKRSEAQDFFDTNAAAIKTKITAPAIGFSREAKKSFASQAAAKQKNIPGVGAYKISDRTFKLLSPSPMARRR